MKKPTLYWPILFLAVLTHCGKRPAVNVDDSVRDPAEQNNTSLQIQPMVPAAVKTLIAEAGQHLANGQEQLAIVALKRALQISPDSPLVQQELAEAWLTEGDYQQALNWAKQVTKTGPEYGPLCERSQRTVALAAELLGDTETQTQALEAIASCQPPALNRF